MSIIPASRLSASELASLGNNLVPAMRRHRRPAQINHAPPVSDREPPVRADPRPLDAQNWNGPVHVQ